MTARVLPSIRQENARHTALRLRLLPASLQHRGLPLLVRVEHFLVGAADLGAKEIGCDEPSARSRIDG